MFTLQNFRIWMIFLFLYKQDEKIQLSIIVEREIDLRRYRKAFPDYVY